MALHVAIEHDPLANSLCAEISQTKGYDNLFEPIRELLSEPLRDGALASLEDGSDVIIIADFGGIRSRVVLVQFVTGGCTYQHIECGDLAMVTVSRRHVRVLTPVKFSA